MSWTEQEVKQTVQQKYGEAARRARSGNASCCGERLSTDPITAELYEKAQTEGLPAEAVLASLGCGNPTALAELKPGEVVLDLGSGGGIDVLLSARRVGPAGKAYGLDMTDDMLALARENQRKAGVENVEFLKGEIENIPLPDNSVDVIVSNCVINLSADKTKVLREAFRVLKPGGRFAVSDIVVRGEVPEAVRRSVELWIGCLAGALEEGEFRAKLEAAGFAGIDLEPTRIYRAEDARAYFESAGVDVDLNAIDGKFASMFVRARKPLGTKVEIYDPAMCCPTGVCGPSVDAALVRFAGDAAWLASQGVKVERHNLAQEPQAFLGNPAVKSALNQEGTKCLPLMMVDGRIVSQGRYPDRAELARWAGVPEDAAELKPQAPASPVLETKGCCS